MSGLRTGDRQLMRELNTTIVINCLRREGPLPRTDVASQTGLGRSTVSGIVKELIGRGLVTVTGSQESSGGRRAELLAFAPECYKAVGVKIQPDAVLACRTDLDGRIETRARLIIGSPTAESVLQEVDDAVRAVVDGVAMDRVLGMGVAVPGLVDHSGVSVTPHFFPWHNLPLRALLEERFALPVFVQNDAHAGALGEKWSGHGVGVDHFLFVTLGIGVGGSVVLNGSPITGELTGAGHVGHTFVESLATPCRCGQVGCLEMVAADEALVRYYACATGEPAMETPASAAALARGRDAVYAAAREGSIAAVAAVERQCAYLAIGLANIVKLLGVRRIIVGGEAAESGGSYLLRHLAKQTSERLFAEVRHEVEIMPSRLGNDVWLIGAAALVLEDAFRAPIYGRHGVRGSTGIAARPAIRRAREPRYHS